jgi:hypothetical protein
VAHAARIVCTPDNRLRRDLLVRLRADRQPEPDEEQVHDPAVHAQRPRDDIA